MSKPGSSDLAAVAEAAAVAALKEVDPVVWPGEFVVLLGRSGSGKSTVLNLVDGIEEPTSGQIVGVAGTDIASWGGKQRTTYRRDRVGFVFQFFNLVPTLTALESVEIIAELTGKVPLGAVARRRPIQDGSPCYSRLGHNPWRGPATRNGG